MNLAFFDEFGHIGPFEGRQHPKYNHSPVFGLAGFVIPHHRTRSFSTWFLQLKQNFLQAEIKALNVHPATWEKKGSALITTKNIKNYDNIRNAIFRLINKIDDCGGRVIFYGREKYQSAGAANAGGLYTTVLSHTIRQVDSYCNTVNYPFLMILDQHEDRTRLLESATKTMFGSDPARRLIEPPYQVESHLYQTIQAADWLATLVGRIMAYKVRPQEFQDWKWAETLFERRLARVLTHSTLWRPRSAGPKPRSTPPQPAASTIQGPQASAKR